MFFSKWLLNLRSMLAPGRGRHAPPRRGSPRAGRHRPRLEALEDRLTPSYAWDGIYRSEPPPGVVWAPSLPLQADVTSDGIPDRIDLIPYNVAVRPGRGDGTFGDPIFSFVHATGGASGVADLNGDGQLDVFVASTWDGGTQTAWGNALTNSNPGDGSFFSDSFPVDYVSGVFSLPLAIGTGDINDDGLTDVIVAGTSEGYDTLYVVLRNDSPPPPPGPPTLRIDNATITEGNVGAVSATFTVRLSAASSPPITVAYATADGTATGSDYQAASGTLTFAPGETQKSITVLVNGDRLPEPNETFLVNLSSPNNATIVDGQGAGTITDDEPRISITDVTRYEGRKGRTTLFTFTVFLSAAYDQPVTMSFQTANGTARTSDNDYVAKSGTLTFAPGETSKTITIEVMGDSKREGNETFSLDLFGLSSNALFTKNRGLGTILNDD